jgi:4-diphosphocytidyl-2-C-methyl-D-erythritol kinase
MILFPPAKINLGLHVTEKRADGYHIIDTVMVQLPLVDVLEILSTDSFLFTTGGLQIEGAPDDNLCVKAYKLLHRQFAIPPVHIHLHKRIPMGAGLGGGSADAAYTLMGLNALFELNLSRQELEDFAAELGSDCPFFITQDAKHCTGRGEIMRDIPLTLVGKYIKLLSPSIHSSTQEAYAGITPKATARSTEELVNLPIAEWRDVLKNDFETSLFTIHPALNILKQSLYTEGAIYAAMSGSGSCLFGIFDKEPSVNSDSETWGWVGVMK